MKKLIIFALVASATAFALQKHGRSISEEIDTMKVSDLEVEIVEKEPSYVQTYSHEDLKVSVYSDKVLIKEIDLRGYVPFPVIEGSRREVNGVPFSKGIHNTSYYMSSYYSQYFDVDTKAGDFFQFKFFYSYDEITKKSFFSIHPYVGKFSEGYFGDLFVAANTHFFEVNKEGVVKKIFEVDGRQIMPIDISSYSVEYSRFGESFYHIQEIVLDKESLDELQNFKNINYFVDSKGQKVSHNFNLKKSSF